MSWWNDVTKPVDKVLESPVFKAVMPVQALGQEAVKLGSGTLGVNHGAGLTPSTQYAIGAGTGAAFAGGSALMGSGSATPAASSAPTSSGISPWEAHALASRQTSDDYPKRQTAPEPVMPQLGQSLPGLGQ